MAVAKEPTPKFTYIERAQLPVAVDGVIKEIQKHMMDDRRDNRLSKKVPNMPEEFFCSEVIEDKKKVIDIIGKDKDGDANLQCYQIFIPFTIEPYEKEPMSFVWSGNVISFRKVSSHPQYLAVRIEGNLAKVKDYTTGEREWKFFPLSSDTDEIDLPSKPLKMFLKGPLVFKQSGHRLLSSNKMTISWLRSRLHQALNKYRECEKDVEVIATIKQKDGGPLFLQLHVEACSNKLTKFKYDLLFILWPALRVSRCQLAVPVFSKLDEIPSSLENEIITKHCLWKIVTKCDDRSHKSHQEEHEIADIVDESIVITSTNISAGEKDDPEASTIKPESNQKTIYKKSIDKQREMTLAQRHLCQQCSNPASRMLFEYYFQHGYIPDGEMNDARSFVWKILNFLRKSIEEDRKSNDPAILKFVESGSVSENLKVVQPDEFDVMIAIDLPRSTDSYTFVEDDTFPPGFAICRVKKRKSFSSGLKRCFRKSDDFGHCLAPEQLAFGWLYGKLERAINKFKMLKEVEKVEDVDVSEAGVIDPLKVTDVEKVKEFIGYSKESVVSMVEGVSGVSEVEEVSGVNAVKDVIGGDKVEEVSQVRKDEEVWEVKEVEEVSLVDNVEGLSVVDKDEGVSGIDIGEESSNANKAQVAMKVSKIVEASEGNMSEDVSEIDKGVRVSEAKRVEEICEIDSVEKVLGIMINQKVHAEMSMDEEVRLLNKVEEVNSGKIDTEASKIIRFEEVVGVDKVEEVSEVNLDKDVSKVKKVEEVSGVNKVEDFTMVNKNKEVSKVEEVSGVKKVDDIIGVNKDEEAIEVEKVNGDEDKKVSMIDEIIELENLNHAMAIKEENTKDCKKNDEWWKKANLKLKRGGPALLLEITPPQMSKLPPVISVDLVLALRLGKDDSRYAVAKRAREEHFYKMAVKKLNSSSECTQSNAQVGSTSIDVEHEKEDSICFRENDEGSSTGLVHDERKSSKKDDQLWSDLSVTETVGNEAQKSENPLAEGPHKITEDERKELARKNLKYLWRISYSEQEKRYLEYVKDMQQKGGVEGCQNICLMILKTICKREILKQEESVISHKLSSYILKTALFHILARTDWLEDWQMDCLADRYVDLLDQLSKWNELPHFFFSNSHLREIFPEDAWCEQSASKNLLDELHATLKIQLFDRFAVVTERFKRLKGKIDKVKATSTGQSIDFHVFLSDVLGVHSAEEVIHPSYRRRHRLLKRHTDTEARRSLIAKEPEDIRVSRAAKAERKIGPRSDPRRNLERSEAAKKAAKDRYNAWFEALSDDVPIKRIIKKIKAMTKACKGEYKDETN